MVRFRSRSHSCASTFTVMDDALMKAEEAVSLLLVKWNVCLIKDAKLSTLICHIERVVGWLKKKSSPDVLSVVWLT